MGELATRREALLLVAASAGVVALGGAASARPEVPMAIPSHDMQACIDECEKAKRLCLEMTRYCMDRGGVHANSARLGLLIDCAEACQATANFMLRGSAVHTTLCGACAEIRDRCAGRVRVFLTTRSLRSARGGRVHESSVGSQAECTSSPGRSRRS